MRGILVAVVFSSLFAAGYVLLNGLENVYDLFGLGLKLAGGEALAASLAGAGGAFAIWLGISQIEVAGDEGTSKVAGRRRLYRSPSMALGVVLLALAGYLLSQGDSGTFLDDLSVGDCFQTPAEVEVAIVEVVPCEEPHDEEIYAIKTLPHTAEEPYPGLLAVDEAAFTACLDDFRSFVGVSYETSVLDIFWFSPTAEAWVDGDRRVVCSVARVDLQRSVGTARALGE